MANEISANSALVIRCDFTVFTCVEFLQILWLKLQVIDYKLRPTFNHLTSCNCLLTPQHHIFQDETFMEFDIHYAPPEVQWSHLCPQWMAAVRRSAIIFSLHLALRKMLNWLFHFPQAAQVIPAGVPLRSLEVVRQNTCNLTRLYKPVTCEVDAWSPHKSFLQI